MITQAIWPRKGDCPVPHFSYNAVEVGHGDGEIECRERLSGLLRY